MKSSRDKFQGLISKGRVNDALKLAVRLCKQVPDSADNWLLQASASAQLGDMNNVVLCCQHVASIDPHNLSAHYNMAVALQHLGQFERALQAYRAALDIDIDSDNSQLLNGIALCHLRLGLTAEAHSQAKSAEAHYLKALEATPELASARGQLGRLLSALGRYTEARSHFERLLQTNPADFEIVSALSLSYEQEGEYDKAVEILDPFMDKHTHSAPIALAFAALAIHQHKETEAIAHLQTSLDRTESQPYVTDIHFALGKLLDRDNAYDDAFQHYAQANQSLGFHYNVASTQKEFSALKNAFSSPASSAQISNCDSDLPIFIIGMPRSGTSLIEQILASHPDVYGAGELNHMAVLVNELQRADSYPAGINNIGTESLAKLSSKYLKQISLLAPNAARIVDKMPHNFMALGLIDRLFPNAHVIHCIRDPRDTCLSIYFQPMTGNHPYTNSLQGLADYYREYESLMRHWKQQIKIPILEVAYEDLIDQTESISRDLIGFCGLNWDAKCLEFHNNQRVVTTPTYDDVRQPIYRRSAQRWKKYQAHLGPLNALAGATDER